MKAILRLLIIALLLTIDGGCARHRRTTEPISTVYRNAQGDVANKITEDLTKKAALGYVKPYVPVMNPPEVKRAWVVPHRTSDGSLIGGYWAYVVIRDASWYIETPQMSLPTVVVPYKEETPPRKKEGEQPSEPGTRRTPE